VKQTGRNNVTPEALGDTQLPSNSIPSTHGQQNRALSKSR
jgi:hypothetical protein